LDLDVSGPERHVRLRTQRGGHLIENLAAPVEKHVRRRVPDFDDDLADAPRAHSCALRIIDQQWSDDRTARHATGWSSTRGDVDSTGLARFDLEAGTAERRMPEPGVRATEPLLSDGGRWLLSLVQCEHDSCVGVVDPHARADAPRAKIQLAPSPITAHGISLPARRSA
jgi:hypothetical protein